MESVVFRIKNLTCEYVSNQPVFEIDDLVIPRGKLIFLIGKSGIGKSTFIETLGLMSKTIVASEDTSIQFFGDDSEYSEELKESWQQPNLELSEFRKKHFSFIFQSTNLMPNFTAGENMMMGSLIDGKSIKEAKRNVMEVMTQLSLPEEVFDKKITALSGGQRQRLAFVRAITANYSVLFGDEPTGNLDEQTADELMKILKDQLLKENRTGIIVSHDLRLAHEFADVVVPITHRLEGETKIGEINNQNVIHKKDNLWINGAGEQISNATDYLRNFL